MKKLLFIGMLLITTNHFSQSTNINSEPFIEVIGSAQKEVIPDRIYISILLTDKIESNEDFSIQIQEENLKKTVSLYNIDSKDLFLSGAYSEVTKNKSKNNETGIRLIREYTLILKNSEEVNKIFQELTDMNIKGIAVKKTEYSDIENVKKEVRQNAIKATKEQAEYLLTSIGEEISIPLEIREVEEKPFKNTTNNTSIPWVNDNLQTSFEKIVVKFSYYIKYAID